MAPASLILLDSCSVINLYATRRMHKVVAVVPGTVGVADVVARESQFVRRGGSGEDAEEREPVDLRAMIAAGLLTVLATDEEAELLTYLDFTLEVDDGEAMTAALAIHRQAVVVTDDRKAIRLLVAHGVELMSTLDIIRHWCDRGSVPRRERRELPINIQDRARYEPRANHPHRPWWDAAMMNADP